MSAETGVKEPADRSGGVWCKGERDFPLGGMHRSQKMQRDISL